MLRRMLLAAGTAALTGHALGQGGGTRAATAGEPRSHIPDVEVRDQDGRACRFYSDLVRDRTVLINFFFTSCSEICPLVTQNLRETQDVLGDRVGQDIFFYSVSLQPALETPAVLKDYAEQWDVRPGWKFLTGRPDEVERLRRAIGFASVDPDEDLVLDNHTGLVRYGNDTLDRWAGSPGLARPAWIAKAVTSLAGAA